MLALRKCEVCGLGGRQNWSGFVQVGIRESVVSVGFCRKESILIVRSRDKSAFQAGDACLGGSDTKKLDDRQVGSAGGKNISPDSS